MEVLAVRIVTPPAEEPVTLAEAKARLRVTWDDEDGDIAALLAEVRTLVESTARRHLVSATIEAKYDAFPPRGKAIRLPRVPVVSVVSVSYYATDGTLTTLDGSAYYTALAGEPARLVPVSGWPSVQCGRPEAVIVRHIVGYGAAADVPREGKGAVLDLLAFRWKKRGDESATAIPATTQRFLDLLDFGEIR